MVSYYNSLSMFPPHHQSRAAPGVTGSGPTPPLGYHGYPHPSYQPYAGASGAPGTPDQNANLHLYAASAAAAQFDFVNNAANAGGGNGPPNVGIGGWPNAHNPSAASWSASSFCRSSYDWEPPSANASGQPGNQSPDLATSETSTTNAFTPTSPPSPSHQPAGGFNQQQLTALGSNRSPTASPEQFNSSSSDQLSAYKNLDGPPAYKQEPISSSTNPADYILPTHGVQHHHHVLSGGLGAGHQTPTHHHPGLDQSADLADDCDDDGPDSPGSSISPSRPGPARSPYEWMKKPSFHSPTRSSDPNARTRTKDKYRVVYSDHQRLELEKEFHYSRYITIRRKAELANCIGLSERQVKIWFQNRRAKERRSMKKQEDVLVKEKLDVNPSLGAFSPPNMAMDHFAPSSLGMTHFHSFPHTFPTFMKYE